MGGFIMINFNWKALSLTCICAVFMVIGATDTFAYGTFGGGCNDCHNNVDQFKGPGEPLHDLHQDVLSSCSSTLCHSSDFSVSLNAGTGCVGCHGRLEDAGNDFGSDGLGAGLRQWHENNNEASCGGCHGDNAGYTPVGEHVFPPFYIAAGLSPYTDSLDNDGDLLYDGADPDFQVYGIISGAIQAGVTVEIYKVNCGTTDPVAELTTDENGNYEYGDLENGRYFVAAIEDDIFNFVPRHSWFDIPQVTIQSYDFTAIITVE
jgi:hypothetical protein